MAKLAQEQSIKMEQHSFAILLQDMGLMTYLRCGETRLLELYEVYHIAKKVKELNPLTGSPLSEGEKRLDIMDEQLLPHFEEAKSFDVDVQARHLAKVLRCSILRE